MSYQKTMWRLIDAFASAQYRLGVVNTAPFSVYHKQQAEKEAYAAQQALVTHVGQQDGGDGKRVLREVFALCEDTEDKCSGETGDFARGRRFEAKGISRAIGIWYQDEFCGRTHIGEPAAPAASERRCDMGVGCEMVGVCYAKAQGRPELCPETHTQPQSVELPEPMGTEAGEEAYTAGYFDGEAAGYARGRKEAGKLREALEKLARLGNGDSYGNSVGNQIAIAALAEEECALPPLGWRCTRGKGHNGPCVAVECPEDIELVERAMKSLRGEVKP